MNRISLLVLTACLAVFSGVLTAGCSSGNSGPGSTPVVAPKPPPAAAANVAVKVPPKEAAYVQQMEATHGGAPKQGTQ